MDKRFVTVILGGGRGTRLFPLTDRRAKPAVPLGGKYRLIDIPVSNAINSDLRRIFVLTQFNSASLNRHVVQTYRFDPFSKGFVTILAAEQTEQSGDWYQGTADAVRKQLHHFARPGVEHVVILSGDHLYRMDYRELIETHLKADADVTVSTIPVTREECTGFGVLRADEAKMVRAFREKPPEDEDLSHMQAPAAVAGQRDLGRRQFLASMGVYIFRMSALLEALELPGANDFGKDILPAMISSHRVAAHLFDGYWEDIGTTSAFFEANLALCREDPPFRFWDEDAPIYTRPRFLPATRFIDTKVSRSIVSDGCLITGATLDRCVVGLRARIGRGVSARAAVILGADIYEPDALRARNAAVGRVDIGVGEGTVLERVIMDKNARVGAGCVLRGVVGHSDIDGPGWSMRDGIVIVHKNAVIPPGTIV